MTAKINSETDEFIVQAFPMVKCDNPECKKGEFCRPTKAWGYKLYYKGRMLFFCSYSCMRIIEKKKEAEESEKRKSKKLPPKVDLRRRKESEVTE